MNAKQNEIIWTALIVDRCDFNRPQAQQAFKSHDSAEKWATEFCNRVNELAKEKGELMDCAYEIDFMKLND